MTDRELVQQALDAFGGLLVFNPSPAEYKQGRDVVAALRDRLAQPEQEPVVLMDAPLLLNGQPLYTTPPQRPWVGLTDKNRQELAAEQHSWEGLCFAVEAKLKEKNT